VYKEIAYKCIACIFWGPTISEAINEKDAAGDKSEQCQETCPEHKQELNVEEH
jgi:hypothetical protein